MHVLEKTKHLISKPLYDVFNNLFCEMITANIDNRIKIDKLIKDYEIILENEGLLRKYNYIFRKNKLKKREIQIINLVNDFVNNLRNMNVSKEEKESIIHKENPPTISKITRKNKKFKKKNKTIKSPY